MSNLLTSYSVRKINAFIDKGLIVNVDDRGARCRIIRAADRQGGRWIKVLATGGWVRPASNATIEVL
jgi:hypothetical protein